MRYIVILLLLAIPITLLSSLYALMRDKSGGDRIAKALTWRIGLSLLLFILLVVIYRMGWVSGHLFPTPVSQ